MSLAINYIKFVDRVYFENNPGREFYARPFEDGETPVPFFASDRRGGFGEVNVTIVRRVVWGRVRRYFRITPPVDLTNDEVIKKFLRSRDQEPELFGFGGILCMI